MQLSRRARKACRRLQERGEREKIIQTIRYDTMSGRAAAERHYLDHYRVADRRGAPEPRYPDPRTVDLSGGFWLEPQPEPRYEFTTAQIWLCRAIAMPLAALAIWGVLEAITRLLLWIF